MVVVCFVSIYTQHPYSRDMLGRVPARDKDVVRWLRELASAAHTRNCRPQAASAFSAASGGGSVSFANSLLYEGATFSARDANVGAPALFAGPTQVLA